MGEHRSCHPNDSVQALCTKRLIMHNVAPLVPSHEEQQQQLACEKSHHSNVQNHLWRSDNSKL